MITEYIELPTTHVRKSDAVTLAHEILAACGEPTPGQTCSATGCGSPRTTYCIQHYDPLPRRGRKLADKQPCGCVLVRLDNGFIDLQKRCGKPHHYWSAGLAEDPNAVWEGEPAPVDAVAVREAAIREAAEWVVEQGEAPVTYRNRMLSALLPTGKHPQCCEPGSPCECRCHIAAAQLDGAK